MEGGWNVSGQEAAPTADAAWAGDTVAAAAASPQAVQPNWHNGIVNGPDGGSVGAA